MAPVEAAPPMETTTAMPPETTPMAPGATSMMPPATTAGMPPATGAMLNADEKAFLADAVRSNEEEIATTELGMAQGNAKAKEVSQMLNADHVALRGEVAALAPDMPAPPGKAPAALAGVKGEAFDGRLSHTYVEQHQRRSTSSPLQQEPALSEPVRALATKTLRNCSSTAGREGCATRVTHAGNHTQRKTRSIPKERDTWHSATRVVAPASRLCFDGSAAAGDRRRGGRAAHAQGVAHEFDSEEAREAGRKGGQARSQPARRTCRPAVIATCRAPISRTPTAWAGWHAIGPAVRCRRIATGRTNA